MTRDIALAVQRDVTDQMKLIRDMAREVDVMLSDAKKNDDKELLHRAQMLARKLDELSRKAYEVGETVIVNAA